MINTKTRFLVLALACSGSLMGMSGVAGAATQVSGGAGHTCAIVNGGTVKCWGDNYYGQLGDGTKATSNTPVAVQGISGATQVTGGDVHTCAIVDGGTVKCWGANYYGQLGDGTNTTSNTPVTVQGVTGATQLTGGAGSNHTCALVAGGTVKCWGWNWRGQLGIGTSGTNTDSNTPVTVQGISGATQVTGGNTHTCALLAGGTIKCWGANAGQLGDGTNNASNTPVAVQNITGATQIIAGGEYTCAIVAGGTVKCWGYNYYGHLGDGTNTDSNTPVTVQGIGGATRITAGTVHTCALVAGGAVRCWGANYYGHLGDGTTTTSYTPVAVQGITGATQITGGGAHTCALVGGGGIKCWGRNQYGQLGDGTTADRNVPVAVQGLDSKPAAPVVTRAPATAYTGKAVTFTITASAGAVLACKLDGTARPGCASPLALTGLAEGPHTLTVTQAVTGYTSPSEPATLTWTVDSVAPSVIGNPRSSRVKTSKQTSYRLTTSSDPSGIAKAEYSTAASRPSATASPVAARTVTYAKPLIFKTSSTIKWIRIRDGAGNWSGWYTG